MLSRLGHKFIVEAHLGRICSHVNVNDGSLRRLDALSAGARTARSSTATALTGPADKAGFCLERAFFAQAGTS